MTTPPTPDFEFFSELHQYVVDNNLQPHVTGVLEEHGLVDYSMVKPDVLERKSVLGQVMHEATRHYDAGMRHDYALEQALGDHPTASSGELEAEECAGYMFAWLDFCKHGLFEFHAAEYRHVGRLEGMFCGMQADRFAKHRQTLDPWILDIKCTASAMKSWPIQLAGYRLLSPAPEAVLPHEGQVGKLGCKWRGAVVWLRKDGSFRLMPGGRQSAQPTLELHDEQVFRSCLYLTHWKRANL